MAQKVVVTVKLGEGDGRKRKSEGPPLDSWSWRKYGQKAIKESPHRRAMLKVMESTCCLEPTAHDGTWVITDATLVRVVQLRNRLGKRDSNRNGGDGDREAALPIPEPATTTTRIVNMQTTA
ncbi:PREDICTED: probable WRKY transcription factor 65 [Ipomoea nil]|uniref:probable WRKY transcription factor 65 n=1 Tax=Ipomoea nil TaxID=35883 RepID=UPI00090089D5|nr:PREDICTED: probable WRKY transcription factor 65 [Ipomoea nil]